MEYSQESPEVTRTDDPRVVWRPEVYRIASSALDPEVLAYLNAGGYKLLETAVRDRDVGIATDSEMLVEVAGRACYRSAESRSKTTGAYVRDLLEKGHGSVLEHASVTFAIVGVSRTLTAELLRHRVGCAVSQESQRFVNAADVRFVLPPLMAATWGGLPVREFNVAMGIWMRNNLLAVGEYNEYVRQLTAAGWARKEVQEASRSMIPNCAETRLVWTVNLRAARHILELRGSAGVDLEMRRFVLALLAALREVAATVFADFHEEPAPVVPILKCLYHKV